jgi:hypothetical protein
MKRLAVACGIFLVSGVGIIRAEDYPWCVQVDAFTKNCGFATRDECLAVAKNVSSPATGEGRCVANPNYVAPPAPAKSAKAAPTKTSGAKPPAKPH